ncbi:Transcriptional regulator PadR-like family protein [Paenibacillus sp. UNCCL117]|uniref:PadR family transcriptional regulator n=1 Tax=unclassified Paenibacillus TaxID=185978 RepID=UPI0008861289|nr:MULTISPECIES: helix-turn-helix transcriptional regulator [unclassified Paenibacillus]SDD82884.1 Transcriptional regulator PadR-like family protein [Paenibacillus sp. cl123]SFW55022.1 Transcriptional regulator PadR-like family protein [Paenibacillus sp. UNCCL117]
MKEKPISRYMPISETAYYILLSLTDKRHGYGIIQYVNVLTRGRIRLGAGTVYGSLARMEKDGLIQVVAEEERRKLYRISSAGADLLKLEIARVKEMYEHATRVEDALR